MQTSCSSLEGELWLKKSRLRGLCLAEAGGVKKIVELIPRVLCNITEIFRSLLDDRSIKAGPSSSWRWLTPIDCRLAMDKIDKQAWG